MGVIDLTSIESIVHAMYASISGPAGAPRDWEVDRLVHHPGARLMPTRPTPQGGGTVEVFSVDQYIASRTPMFAANAFYEVEIAREEIRFGNIAQVLSVYESRRTPDGPPFTRGINSIQFFWDGSRWWVMSILWDNERPGVEIPQRLLRG